MLKLALFWIPLGIVLMLAISTEGFILNKHDSQDLGSKEEKHSEETIEPEKLYYDENKVVEGRAEESVPEPWSEQEFRGTLMGRSLPAKSLPRLG
ncbi:unnamed protein product [Allacma fusca]|uniref:Uncharacterized protein n=1 Tax=Allacma fusca TaxID=39272 RepID=A0A8J2LT08_9HEXA|nr:unnamed protein product [Allacma fusca]